jgi:hypothetical protein
MREPPHSPQPNAAKRTASATQALGLSHSSSFHGRAPKQGNFRFEGTQRAATSTAWHALSIEREAVEHRVVEALAEPYRAPAAGAPTFFTRLKIGGADAGDVK